MFKKADWMIESQFLMSKQLSMKLNKEFIVFQSFELNANRFLYTNKLQKF